VWAKVSLPKSELHINLNGTPKSRFFFINNGEENKSATIKAMAFMVALL
jgi:hypothetical protein